ncbi:hypothetical protein HZB88_04010 [archaeon]|nr:hypothetical protein [archaeon]
MEDVEAVIKQPNTVILPDTNFLYPPPAFLTDNFPFCIRSGKWLDYIISLSVIGDTQILGKVAGEIMSYTGVVGLLQHKNVYATVGVSREIQNTIRFFSKRYSMSLNGNSPENRRMVKNTIGRTIGAYKQLKNFFLGRELEGPYLDVLGVCCEKYYYDIQEAVQNVRFPEDDEPNDNDKELIGMSVYLASLSPNHKVVTLSNDHHIHQGVRRVCQYVRDMVPSDVLSVMGINLKTGRLEEKYCL